MALLLNVPYEDKDEAKALGARWNPELKKWYAPNSYKYPDFYKWMDFPQDEVCHIIIDDIDIIESPRICYRCGRQIRVMAFHVDKYYQIWDPVEYRRDITNPYDFFDFHRLSIIPDFPLPDSFLSQDTWNELDNTFHFHMGYSRTAGYYRANHCPYCKALQGAFELFNEDDDVFSNPETTRIFKKIPLEYDQLIGDELL